MNGISSPQHISFTLLLLVVFFNCLSYFYSLILVKSLLVMSPCKRVLLFRKGLHWLLAPGQLRPLSVLIQAEWPVGWPPDTANLEEPCSGQFALRAPGNVPSREALASSPLPLWQQKMTQSLHSAMRRVKDTGSGVQQKPPLLQGHLLRSHGGLAVNRAEGIHTCSMALRTKGWFPPGVGPWPPWESTQHRPRNIQAATACGYLKC